MKKSFINRVIASFSLFSSFISLKVVISPLFQLPPFYFTANNPVEFISPPNPPPASNFSFSRRPEAACLVTVTNIKIADVYSHNMMLC